MVPRAIPFLKLLVRDGEHALVQVDLEIDAQLLLKSDATSW